MRGELRRWSAEALLVGVGIALAVLGTLPAVDAIVPWVFGIVDHIPWADVWRPVYNPEPMDTYAYRPLSVVILKLALALTRSPAVLTAAHGLVLSAFGVVARRWLLRLGFASPVATLAALSCQLVPSLLFSAWLAVEFDLFGAVFVLLAMSELRWTASAAPTSRRFWVYTLVALTVKETSALQLLALLAAHTAVVRDRASLLRLGQVFALLLVLTAPMHFVSGGAQTAFTLFGERFHPVRIAAILFHTLCQVLFVLSPAGALLLALRGVSGRWVAVAALALFLGSPVTRHYSHFEAVIFDAWPLALVACLAIGVGLARAARDASPAIRGVALAAVFTILGYAAAPVLLRFARADVSARIFAALVPFLFALVWESAAALWRAGGVARASAALVGGAFGLFVAGGGLGAVAFHRTRLLVEEAVKERLAHDVRMACPALIATNPVQLTTVEDLKLRGAPLGECAWIETTTTNPESDTRLADFAASGKISVDPGQDAYLLIQTARSLETPERSLALMGDFSWAHELMPEADDDLITAYRRMIYEPVTDIEAMFAREGHRVVAAALPLVQPPLFWTDVLARLWQGLPLFERLEYVGRVYRVDAARPGFVPDGGRIRKDAAPRGPPPGPHG